MNKNSIFHDRLNHNKITFTFIDSETFHYKRAMWFLKFTSLAKVTQTADEPYTLRNYAWLLRRCSKLLRLHNDSPHSFLRIQSLCHKKSSNLSKFASTQRMFFTNVSCQNDAWWRFLEISWNIMPYHFGNIELRKWNKANKRLFVFEIVAWPQLLYGWRAEPEVALQTTFGCWNLRENGFTVPLGSLESQGLITDIRTSLIRWC